MAKTILKECPFCGVAAIEWHFAGLPDDDTTVLLAFEDGEFELAFHSAGHWWRATGPVGHIARTPVAWCHVPYPPERARVAMDRASGKDSTVAALVKDGRVVAVVKPAAKPLRKSRIENQKSKIARATKGARA